jgi:hypothetical protein
MMDIESVKRLLRHNATLAKLTPVNRNQGFLIEQAEEDLAEPEKQLVFAKVFDRLGSCQHRLTYLRFQRFQMLVVALETARNCQLSIWNGRPIQQRQRFIPQGEPALHPFGDDMLGRPILLGKLTAAQEARIPPELPPPDIPISFFLRHLRLRIVHRSSAFQPS